MSAVHTVVALHQVLGCVYQYIHKPINNAVGKHAQDSELCSAVIGSGIKKNIGLEKRCDVLLSHILCWRC